MVTSRCSNGGGSGVAGVVGAGAVDEAWSGSAGVVPVGAVVVSAGALASCRAPP
ncbi:hypothetical protein ACSHWB_36805 [Lentzea sp. HUAS TT2]|uniref:hypothetical protein n=1 Tax=Lentzea sp. HUAS TT2 TaxID=3447454 RepID=UPI003F72C6E7